MTPEPEIRILIGKAVEEGAITHVINLAQMPVYEGEGWQFVLADPDDLAVYLTWLRKREMETS